MWIEHLVKGFFSCFEETCKLYSRIVCEYSTKKSFSFISNLRHANRPGKDEKKKKQRKNWQKHTMEYKYENLWMTLWRCCSNICKQKWSHCAYNVLVYVWSAHLEFAFEYNISANCLVALSFFSCSFFFSSLLYSVQSFHHLCRYIDRIR